MGRFDDRATRPARGPADMLRWKVLDRLAGRKRAPRVGSAPARPHDPEALRGEGASLTWIGHASFVARLGGRVVATDPVWSERLQGVIPRLVPPGVPLDALPPVDVVTLSHNHYDHLDLGTLLRLGPTPLYVVPLGTRALLERAGLPRVVELDWWETHREGSLEVTLVPARHWSMRAPWDRNDALWGGFVLRGPEGTLYHSGDTGDFDGFEEIGRRCGPIDWALLPIGAYEPRWFMAPQHLDPDEACEAFVRLGARTMVPMHWGTFVLTDEPITEPPARVQAFWRARALDPAALWLMDVGETRSLDPR